MTRQIKFRAWDKTTEQFVRFSMNERGMIYDLPQSDCDVILMQFTGLLDKNGVEIYEEDLIKIDSDLAQMFKIKSPNVVTYLRGQFYADKDCNDLSGFSVLADNTGEYLRGEIIGNIYQNSELLKN